MFEVGETVRFYSHEAGLRRFNGTLGVIKAVYEEEDARNGDKVLPTFEVDFGIISVEVFVDELTSVKGANNGR